MKPMLALFAALLLLPACAGTPPATAPSAVTETGPSPLPARAQVLASMERVADWQLGHLDDLSYIPLRWESTKNPRDWQQAAFWVALTHLADRSASPRYRDAILAKGREAGWKLGDRLYHADDHLIGSAWIWAARHGAGPAALAPMRASFEKILARPMTHGLTFTAPAQGGDPACTTRWCWCDALFMAPPTLEALSRETGDPRYARFSDSEYRATRDFLFDPAEQLFFRDSRFIDRRGEHGEKLFWSRGNGWVISGLARLIPELAADDPRRGYYVDLFVEMAERILRVYDEELAHFGGYLEGQRGVLRVAALPSLASHASTAPRSASARAPS